MSEDKFVFTADNQKKLFIAKIAGLVLVVVGILLVAFGGHGHDGTSDAGHHFHYPRGRQLNATHLSEK